MNLEIRDEEAVESMIWFSMNHRAAIADWAAKQFEVASTVADKAAFSIEVFEKFIGAVEDLEMLYFALQAKALASKSFLFLYEDVFIREERKGGKEKKESAKAILRQLEQMDNERFRDSLGLPTSEEFHKVFKNSEGTADEVKGVYDKYLGDLRTAVAQAVSNRATDELMDTYNKIKHGFVVILHPKDGVFMVQGVTSLDSDRSMIEGKPYAPTSERLKQLVDNTKLIAKTCRELLMLHFRRTG